MPYLGRNPAISNTVTGDLAVSGSILADGQISAGRINHKLALNGSDASSPQANENDQFIFEDGGTDGSGTNAGDNLLLEDVTPSQVEVPLASISAAGTSGQFLQSQGSLLAPTFATVATGGMTHIATVEASGTSAEFTGLDSSEYHYYRCMIEDSGSNSNPSYMRFYLGNDSGYYTGGWSYYSFGQYALTDIRQNVNQDYMETENQGYASGGDKYWWWDFSGTKSGEMPGHSMVVYHMFMNGNNSGNASSNQTTSTGHGILAESSMTFTKAKWVSSSGNYTGTKKWRLFGVK